MLTKKCNFVETTLHDVVSNIENTLDKQEFVLPSFLDKVGTFNNVEQNNLEIDQPIIRWTIMKEQR